MLTPEFTRTTHGADDKNSNKDLLDVRVNITAGHEGNGQTKVVCRLEFDINSESHSEQPEAEQPEGSETSLGTAAAFLLEGGIGSPSASQLNTFRDFLIQIGRAVARDFTSIEQILSHDTSHRENTSKWPGNYIDPYSH